MAGWRRMVVLLTCGLLPVMAVAEAAVPGRPDVAANGANAPADLTRFQIARIVYDSVGGLGEAYYRFEGRLWERWETDYPQAEQNLARRLNELTRIVTIPRPAVRRLTAADLGDFPLIFMSDVGYMRFTVEEADALRAYLENGGFLWVDDFWGDAEWASFERFMRQVLPHTRWRQVDVSHPLFHMVFDIERMPQIPARSFAYPGIVDTAESPWAHRAPAGSLATPMVRGYFDDEGRLMAMATHNTDIADGWEREAYGHWYFERFSTQSYRLAVNVMTYVMTH